MKHVNIPIFIPHLGCPNQCVFCNQRSISGVLRFDPKSVKDIIEASLATISADTEVEIAFFGGSFTGIDRSLMIELLEMANSYILDGRVSHIRCSTRPDYIDEEILDILQQYGVKVIELGLQSSSDKVLSLSKRGHDFAAEKKACDLIIKHGFTLVGQMMIGLPGSSLEDEIKTANFIVNSGAKYARIYPTVVFKETELCGQAVNGEYTPLSLTEAVSRSAKVLQVFLDNKVEVIRIGLCSSENLSSEDTYFAGPNHAALGELVKSQIYLNKITEKAKDVTVNENDVLKIYVAKGCLSKAIGQKKNNKFLLTKTLKTENIVFCEANNLSEYEVSVVVEGKNKNVLKIT